MIEIQINTAVFLYLFSFLSLCFILFLLSWNKERKKPTWGSYQKLIICEYCAESYLARSERDVSQCPDCKCFNKHPAR